MEKVYIDTNVFLNAILYDIEKNQEAKRAHTFLQKVINNEVYGTTAVLTWDEFVWVITQQLGREIAIEKGKQFLLFPNISFESITFNTIIKAQDLISKYTIHPRDAIHSASALEHNIPTIISFDDDFDNIMEIERREP